MTYRNICAIILLQGSKKAFRKTASVGKENKMDEMTDLQFKTIINAVIQIIKDNEEKEKMIEKIEALVTKN